MTDIRSINDSFDGPYIDAALWGNHMWDDYNHEFSGGHNFVGHSDHFYSQFDDLEFPEEGAGIQWDGITVPYGNFEYGISNGTIVPHATITNDSASSAITVSGRFEYLRIYRNGPVLRVQVSTDGSAWTEIGTWNAYDTWTGYSHQVDFGGNSHQTSVHGITVVSEPVDPPVDEWPDEFDPDAPMDPVTQPGCSTLLDQIREFSKAIKRPVRIIGSTTIEVVDIDAEGLPDGWSADEDRIYVETSDEVSAGIVALSLDSADRTISASARFKTDDCRYLYSGHRVPQRLPTWPGLPSGAVKRLNLVFTPRSFEANVEFHFMPGQGIDDV